MGSDMMIAVAYAPHFTATAGATLTEVLRGTENQPMKIDLWNAVVLRIALHRIESYQADWEQFGEYYLNDLNIMGWAEDHLWTEQGVKDTLRKVASDLLTQRRDVSDVSIAGAELWATGGMSGGDLPTDAYDLICAIHAMDLFNRVITSAEMHRAIQEVTGDFDG
jgi:hypothetical protein